MPRPPQKTDPRLLSKVSRLYYEQGLNQQEIAERLYLSRPKVSRLLQQARDEGIVRITILPPPNTHSDLEHQLETTFDLREAVVVEASDPHSQEAVSKEVGIAAADYFQRTAQDGDVIGISWGTTLQAMAEALQPITARPAQVVQLVGGLGPPEADSHATNISRRLAQILDCRLIQLPAPGIVDGQVIKRALLSDSRIQSVFEMFSAINVAYVGIGAPTPHSVLMRDGAIITQAELDGLLAAGAVGDIALRFFDHRGQPVRSEVDDRVIGITLEQLRQAGRVVGAAGGPDKVAVIRGALRGGLIDVLITDHVTAGRLLAGPDGGGEQGA